MPSRTPSTVPAAATTASGSAQASSGINPPFVIKLLAPPPVPGAPSGGVQYTPLSKSQRASLRKPTKDQIAHAPAMVSELVWLATQIDWAATFGNLLPTNDQAVQSFTLAGEWSGEHLTAKNWLAQASGNNGVSWDTALHVLVLLAPGLNALLTAHPELAPHLPATKAMMSARAAASQKAATTRKAPATARKRATKQSANAAQSATIADAAEAAQAILHPTAKAPTTPTGGTSSGNGGHTP